MDFVFILMRMFRVKSLHLPSYIHNLLARRWHFSVHRLSGIIDEDYSSKLLYCHSGTLYRWATGEFKCWKIKNWSQHSGLNRGPLVYKTNALPLSYVGNYCNHTYLSLSHYLHSKWWVVWGSSPPSLFMWRWVYSPDRLLNGITTLLLLLAHYTLLLSPINYFFCPSSYALFNMSTNTLWSNVHADELLFHSISSLANTSLTIAATGCSSSDVISSYYRLVPGISTPDLGIFGISLLCY